MDALTSFIVVIIAITIQFSLYAIKRLQEPLEPDYLIDKKPKEIKNYAVKYWKNAEITNGRLAMIGGMTGVLKDVTPFGLSIGNRNYLQGLNLIGLRRKKYDNKLKEKSRKNNKSKINIYWFYASIVFFIISIGLLGGDNGIQNIQQTDISSFENYLKNGDIEKVAIINQRYARITLNENALEKDIHRSVKSKNFLGQENIAGPHYQFEIGTPELFEENYKRLKKQKI